MERPPVTSLTGFFSNIFTAKPVVKTARLHDEQTCRVLADNCSDSESVPIFVSPLRRSKKFFTKIKIRDYEQDLLQIRWSVDNRKQQPIYELPIDQTRYRQNMDFAQVQNTKKLLAQIVRSDRFLCTVIKMLNVGKTYNARNV